MSLVTIIIPYKNNLKYLFLALESIFFQTYKKYKIIIIYDNEDKNNDSIDDLVEITGNKFNYMDYYIKLSSYLI